MRPNSITLWTQLPDPNAADVIEVNGCRLESNDTRSRQDVVGRLSSASRSGRRKRMGDAVFLAWNSRESVAEIPARADSVEQFRPTITVGLRQAAAGEALTADSITGRVAAFAERVGYSVDRDEVRDVVTEMLLVSRPGCVTPWRN
jgi:hypothetical protein